RAAIPRAWLRWHFKIAKTKYWRRKNGRPLLNLRLLELDVFAHDGVVLLEHEFLRARAGILLRHVEEARAGSRDELDFLRDRLGHDKGDLRLIVLRGAAP